jgi:CelD/BcsL family acetyltransferase involved in cellulose biosynthesis
MKVRVVDSEAGFAALAPAWDALHARAAVTSIFAGHDWQHTWWRHYGRGRLRVLVAHEGYRVVGILPLYLDTLPTMRFPVHALRFVGTGGDTFPDDLGPVLAPGYEEDAALALATSAVALRGWDVLLLGDMDPTSAFLAAIARATAGAPHDVRSGRSERIAYLELPTTWDAWLAGLHRDRRYRVRSIRKKLCAAHPGARFFVWPTETLDDGVDRLIALHNKRWERTGQAHSFSTRAYVDFHREVMHACARRDQLRLYALEAAGRVIAMSYYYRFREKIYLMQSGFDPDFGDVKPGQVLLGHVIEHAIGEGTRVLDFLRGDHRYKDELATGDRETVYLTVFRARPGAWVYRARRTVLPAVRAALVDLLGGREAGR